jgi:hypothetical protein
MNKTQIIEQLKSEYPTLTKGINDEVIELDATEYEATIDAWADAQLLKLAKQAEAEAKAEAKAELLERLGITEDEARLLLG